MQIVPSTTPASDPPPAEAAEPPAPAGTAATGAGVARRSRSPLLDQERRIPLVTEPAVRRAPARPRRVEPERDYRSPTPVERARLLRAAYVASVADPEQRLLLAELMAHYRAWCLRHGKGDPFAGL